jgi:hypothetical protein
MKRGVHPRCRWFWVHVARYVIANQRGAPKNIFGRKSKTGRAVLGNSGTWLCSGEFFRPAGPTGHASDKGCAHVSDKRLVNYPRSNGFKEGRLGPVLETYNLQKTRTKFLTSAAAEGPRKTSSMQQLFTAPTRSRPLRPPLQPCWPSALSSSSQMLGSAAAANGTHRQHQHLRAQRRQHRQLDRPPQLQVAANLLAALGILPRRRATEQKAISGDPSPSIP